MTTTSDWDNGSRTRKDASGYGTGETSIAFYAFARSKTRFVFGYGSRATRSLAASILGGASTSSAAESTAATSAHAVSFTWLPGTESRSSAAGLSTESTGRTTTAFASTLAAIYAYACTSVAEAFVSTLVSTFTASSALAFVYALASATDYVLVAASYYRTKGSASGSDQRFLVVGASATYAYTFAPGTR